jgi:lipopolysaccharide transport system ATP-binding protein
MTDLAIQAEAVGKRYQIGQHSGGYQLLSENFARRARTLFRQEEGPDSEFWAVRGVNFSVERGESFGVVGHNGAGKSTLLKILSRITPPTEGEIWLDGRVGALLEVGTGFHPELTGRENIYLNGAVLGMRRAEIVSRFDEIVEFAEVEQFIDTPVKRYSSGMQMRLAFAVAAHLEPEILIVDEVLSVGDAAFQEKCLGRMEEVTGEGRTVLFVSHNLSAVSKLCERSLLLSHGKPVMQGPTQEVIEHYVRSLQSDTGTMLRDRTDRDGTGRLRFESIAFEVDGNPTDVAICGSDFEIAIDYLTEDGAPLRNVNVALSISTMLGETMLLLSTNNTGTMIREVPGEGSLRCAVPRLPLPPGRYLINIFADIGGETVDWIQRASELTVIEGDFYGTGSTGHTPSHPAVMVDHAWRAESHRARARESVSTLPPAE